MTLLDGSSDDTGDADAVASHMERLAAAFGVKKVAIERLAVFGSELKNMADFNPPANLDGLRGVGRTRIPVNGLPQVMGSRFSKIPTPVDPFKMKALTVGATDEICHAGCAMIDDDGYIQPYWSNRAWRHSGGFFNFFGACHA